MPEASRAFARPPPSCRLMALATRLAVVKSGSLSTKVTFWRSSSIEARTPTSTVAPLGTEPVVGWFFCTTLPLES
ncbi:hypothetical protein D3C86_1896870 [compost metagenome]